MGDNEIPLHFIREMTKYYDANGVNIFQRQKRLYPYCLLFSLSHQE